jgi:hypothetical protein
MQQLDMLMKVTSQGNTERRAIEDKWKEAAQIKSIQDVAPDRQNSVWEDRKNPDDLVSFQMRSRAKKHPRFMCLQILLM